MLAPLRGVLVGPLATLAPLRGVLVGPLATLAPLRGILVGPLATLVDLRGATGLATSEKARLAHAKAAWYANAKQISDFLSTANPRHWPDTAMRAMMRTHLDQTLTEGVDQPTGRYTAGVREYDATGAPHPRDVGHALEWHRRAVPRSSS